MAAAGALKAPAMSCAPTARRDARRIERRMYSRPAPPARQGMTLAEVDTPALLLDLEAFEHNLDRLDKSLAETRIRVRPHAKSHKCPEIALRQMARGAIGVCCQKVSEAEAMVEGGVMNVLVSNEVVGTPKLARLAALARRARISVCVDNE